MTEKEILEERLEKITKECNDAFDKFMDMATKDIPYAKAEQWYYRQPCIKEREQLEQKIRLLETEYNMEPIPKYGDKMTLQQFINDCNSGMFIDYDGYGNYATNDQMSDILVHPSDITSGNYRKDFSHVVWFNK